MKQSVLRHEFVEFIPERIEDGVVYVSIPYATAAHMCCCGCGTKVVTPITPTDWKLIFDGETISLYPSIGNWGFPCRSHYWIRNDRVEWSYQMSQKKVQEGRSLDRMAKAQYYGGEPAAPAETTKPKGRGRRN
jgi:hypothetical protein